MSTRWIHKNGRAIPVHSDHGDQQNPGTQHAAPMTPPNHPSPVVGKEEHNHPEARTYSAAQMGALGKSLGMKKGETATVGKNLFTEK